MSCRASTMVGGEKAPSQKKMQETENKSEKKPCTLNSQKI